MILQITLRNKLLKRGKLLGFICFALLSFFPLSLHSQVTLSSGDIMVVGFRSDDTDNFAVMAMVDLTAGDKIHFTDHGWSISDGGFTSHFADNTYTYTVPGGGITAGTVLTAVDMGFSISLDNSDGDHIIIYQTADGNANSSPTLIYAFNNLDNNFATDANGWQSGSTGGINRSDPPAGLTVVTSDGGAGTAFGRLSLPVDGTEDDDVYYSGPSTSASIADWIARIHTVSNWTGDGGGFDSNHPDLDAVLPTSFPIAAANTAPSIAVNNLNYTEGQNNGDPVVIDSGATASDDDDNWNGGSLTVTITANNEAADEISVGDVGNITVNTANGEISSSGTHFATATVNNATVTNGTTLTINFNSSANDVRIQELVRAVRYRNTSTSPGTNTRTVTFVLSDDTEGTTITPTISITAVNTITIAATTSTVTEDGATNLVFRFTRETTSGALVVNFSIEGTAQDSDYAVSGETSYDMGTNTGTITFPDGDDTVDLTVNPTDDSLIEGNETVVVKIEDPTP